MGDVEDVEVYAAEPIYKWQQTGAGKFCMEKAEDIHWVTVIDHEIMGHRVKIVGTLSDKHATFLALNKS
jgi:hypothetical protein